MKKLKKLTLKKETIINLNDNEMNSIKGGCTASTVICSVAVSYTVDTVIETYNQWQSNRPYDCHKQSDYQQVSAAGTIQQSQIMETGYCATSIFEVYCY